jgi:hypothetical protein
MSYIERTSIPGYGEKTRPNPNAHLQCVRDFIGCGASSGTYDPRTRGQLGRVGHNLACKTAWKESGKTSLVGAHAHKKRALDDVGAEPPKPKKKKAIPVYVSSSPPPLSEEGLKELQQKVVDKAMPKILRVRHQRTPPHAHPSKTTACQCSCNAPHRPTLRHTRASRGAR